MTRIHNYHDALNIAKNATILTWVRKNQRLELYLDDIPNDRRTIVNISMPNQTVEVKTLQHYDAQKNRWGNYCAPTGQYPLTCQQGKRHLLEWLRDQAIKSQGITSIDILTIYGKSHAVTQN